MSRCLFFQRSVLLVGGLLLGGCASVMRVDSQVQAYALWPKEADTPLSASVNSYEFERMPSQQAPQAFVDGVPSQAEVERLTREVLAPLGWQMRDPVADLGQPLPRWRVQVSAHKQTLPRAPWDDPTERLWLRPRVAVGASNAGLQLNWMLRTEMPYFVRHLSVVVREQAQGRVVYETQATHDGRWPDSPALWRAMIEAALHGFPQPPAGVQRIDIDIPR